MNSAVLTTIALTGFTVAFFHAAIPTHWLPFVLVARARGWTRAKTIALTLCAGVGHVALTSLLGVAIAWFGFQHHALGSHHQPSAECGHEHDHTHWEEELKDTPLTSTRSGDWTAMSGLFLMLTLSPCEGFLPIYLSGVRFGWRGFALLTAILAFGALAGMTLFTWLTLRGLERIKVQRIERYEAGLVGAMFTLLGVLVILLER
jgi:nickel/cobalt exporter